jgi:dolichol-phosphate mannosyltransferase
VKDIGPPEDKGMISVILPTYNEALNIRRIVCAITKVLRDSAIRGEVIIVDDDSPDGTARIAADLAGSYPVRIHVRTNGRGLAGSIIEGFGLAQGEVCVVMDADLCHPVEKIPEMIKPIIEGNVTSPWRPLYRRRGISIVLVQENDQSRVRFWPGGHHASDPTSGFMAVKRACSRHHS